MDIQAQNTGMTMSPAYLEVQIGQLIHQMIDQSSLQCNDHRHGDKHCFSGLTAKIRANQSINQSIHRFIKCHLSKLLRAIRYEQSRSKSHNLRCDLKHHLLMTSYIISHTNKMVYKQTVTHSSATKSHKSVIFHLFVGKPPVNRF